MIIAKKLSLLIMIISISVKSFAAAAAGAGAQAKEKKAETAKTKMEQSIKDVDTVLYPESGEQHGQAALHGASTSDIVLGLLPELTQHLWQGPLRVAYQFHFKDTPFKIMWHTNNFIVSAHKQQLNILNVLHPAQDLLPYLPAPQNHNFTDIASRNNDILFATDRGFIASWNPVTMHTKLIVENLNPVFKIALAHDKKTLACLQNGIIALVGLKDEIEIMTSPNGTRTEVPVITTNKKQLFPAITSPGISGSSSLAWSQDGRLAFSKSGDLVIYNSKTQENSTITGIGGPVRGLAWAPDNVHFAILLGSAIHIYDSLTLQQLTSLHSQEIDMALIQNITWNQDNNLLLANSNNGNIYIWDPSNHELLNQYNCLNYSAKKPFAAIIAAWSPNSSAIAVSYANGKVFVLEPHTTIAEVRKRTPTTKPRKLEKTEK